MYSGNAPSQWHTWFHEKNKCVGFFFFKFVHAHRIGLSGLSLNHDQSITFFLYIPFPFFLCFSSIPFHAFFLFFFPL